MSTYVRAAGDRALRSTAVAGRAAEPSPETQPKRAAEPVRDEPIVILEKFVTVEYAQTEDTGKGFGQERATVSLPSVDIAVMPPGQNPIILLGKTPGVNVTTSDNIGLYEHANRVQIRTFNINQIAVTLDGLPLGQQNFYGGSPVDRFVDSESLDRVDVSTGIGSVTMPANTALGGAIRYYSKAPKPDMGVALSQSFGDYNYKRSLIRYDTGPILPNLTAYVSFSALTADKWRGRGQIFRDHTSAQLKYTLGEHTFRLRFDYNDRGDYDYRSMSLAIFNQQGRFYEYPETITGDIAVDAAYWDNQFNFRRDTLTSLEGDLALAPELKLNVVSYYDDKYIRGGSNQNGLVGAPFASYQLSLASTPDYLYRDIAGRSYAIHAPLGILFSTRPADQQRYGSVARFDYLLGRHHLAAGGWYQRDYYHRADVRFNRAGGVAGGTNLLDQFVYGSHDVYHTFYTIQLFIEDRIELSDRLVVTAGIKSLDIQDDFEGIKNADDYSRNIWSSFSADYRDNFIPSIGGVYSLSKSSQLYASYAENMAQPVKEVYYADNYPQKRVQAETSKVYELGWRGAAKRFDFALATYLVKYGHRLLSFQDFDPTFNRTVSSYNDVGGLTSKGAEAAIAYYPARGLRFSSSLTYNDTTFDSDYAQNTSATTSVVVPTAGLTVPDFPEYIANVEVNYNWKGFYSGVDARYLGGRFSSQRNTEKIGGYTVFGAFLGYQALANSRLGRLRLQLNVANLTDKIYLGSISPGDVTGSFQPGAPRTISFSASTEF